MDDDIGRTSDIVCELLKRKHAEAVSRDVSVAPVGRPYWGEIGLITQVGLMGVDARKRIAMDPAADPSLSSLMASDPDAEVRALVA